MTPSMRTMRTMPARFGSPTTTLVSCVIVKTKTRSKNSSSVVTRVSRSASPIVGRLTMPIAGLLQRVTRAHGERSRSQRQERQAVRRAQEEGHEQGSRCGDRELRGVVLARRQEVRQRRREQELVEAGRDVAAEEGGRPQGRQGRSLEVLSPLREPFHGAPRRGASENLGAWPWTEEAHAGPAGARCPPARPPATSRSTSAPRT